MMTTRLATLDDAPRISALLMSNTSGRGGMLLGNWSADVIQARIRDKQPVIVAVSEAGLLGVLLTEDKAYASAPPVMAMLEAWPGGPDAYVYGPVCVDKDARGKGVLQALYAELVAQFPGREAILFIRADNPRSLQAHLRLGMNEVARYTFAGETFLVLSNRSATAAV
jgi:L-amino acid N-acyltransferase YncA